MKLSIGPSAQIQGDVRQWTLERLSGSPAKRYYRSLDATLKELSAAPRRPHIYCGDDLVDLGWAVVAEHRSLNAIGAHPAARFTYRAFPLDWRAGISGVAELSRDAHNLIVKPRGGELAFFERLDHALIHAWALQVRRSPGIGAAACIEVMDASAAPIMTWLDGVTLRGNVS